MTHHSNSGGLYCEGQTMNEHDILMAAILAAPEDDAPRLVYADWLDEHGEPDRAAFIRSSIIWENIDNRRGAWDRDEFCKHFDIANDLRKMYAETWFGGVPCLMRDNVYPHTIDGISRGFLSHCRCTFAEYIRHAPAVAREHPITRWSITDLVFLKFPTALAELKNAVYVSIAGHIDSKAFERYEFFRYFRNALHESYPSRFLYPSHFPDKETGEKFVGELLVRVAREWSKKL